jgi:hypothetical protein
MTSISLTLPDTQKRMHVVDEHLFCCTFSVDVEHKGEIAVQGFGNLGPNGTTFRITASSGSIYKGEEGTLTSTPDETKTKYYKVQLSTLRLSQVLTYHSKRV